MQPLAEIAGCFGPCGAGAGSTTGAATKPICRASEAIRRPVEIGLKAKV
ncbi:hypothetical protein [Bradyrhizobium elkanii]|nr:hypothetical protein [Bradyrhizobium elkanii]